MGVAALVLAVPGLWEGVTVLGSDRGRAWYAFVGVALPVRFSGLMLALGLTLLRQLVPLTPQIVVNATQLPPPFHKDPADQVIVATARVFHCPLVTMDTLIRAYPHVKLLP